MDLGLLQREVGERMGVHEATIYLWEVDQVTPEARRWPAIIGFLGHDPRPEPKTVGERLVRYREARGWSQKRFAEALQVDPTTLSRWELGKKTPWGIYRERVEAIIRARDRDGPRCQNQEARTT